MRIIALIILTLSFISCLNKHVRTDKICNKRLFVEFFDRTGMGTSYLTDSLNFRFRIGRFNPESEGYHFICKQDCLYIQKIHSNIATDLDSINNETLSKQLDKVEIIGYDLKVLKKDAKFEK